MSYQTKSKIANILVYIVLGLIVASIMGVAIITFTSANNSIGPLTTPCTESTPTANATHQPNKTPTPDKTIINTPTPEQTTTPEPTGTKVPVIVDVTENFVHPASGHLMKECSLDCPVYSFTMADYRTHSGVDISAAEGSPVFAVADGIISKVYNDVLMGKTIEIDHGQNVISIYSNLADELPDGITAGSEVAEGAIIGSVGSSSLLEIAESDHLHFSLTVNGEYRDPLDYFDFSSASLTDEPGNE